MRKTELTGASSIAIRAFCSGLANGGMQYAINQKRKAQAALRACRAIGYVSDAIFWKRECVLQRAVKKNGSAR